jgi:hypothetical protein
MSSEETGNLDGMSEEGTNYFKKRGSSHYKRSSYQVPSRRKYSGDYYVRNIYKEWGLKGMPFADSCSNSNEEDDWSNSPLSRDSRDEDFSEIPELLPLCKLPTITTRHSTINIFKGNKSIEVGHYILPFEGDRGKIPKIEEISIIRSVKIEENAKKVTFLDEGILGQRQRANMEKAVESLITSNASYRYNYGEVQDKTAFLVWVDEVNRFQFRAVTKGDSQFIVFRLDKNRTKKYRSHLCSVVGSYSKTEFCKDPESFVARQQLVNDDIVVLGSSEFFSKLTERQIELSINCCENDQAPQTSQDIAQKLAELAVNFSKCAALFKPTLKVDPHIKDISVVVMKMISVMSNKSEVQISVSNEITD